MLNFRFSMRFTLGATIVLMGMLGLVLALTTGEVYRRQALESQRLALKELAQITVSEQLHELEERARDLGLALQSEPGFRRALASGQRDVLVHQLLDQFRQYFVTASIIKLEKLVAYDTRYRLLGTANAGSVVASNDAPGCATLIDRARVRASVERVQLLAALCRIMGQELKYTRAGPRPGDIRHSCLDVGKALRTMGWKPAVSLEEGLSRTVTWFAGAHA